MNNLELAQSLGGVPLVAQDAQAVSPQMSAPAAIPNGTPSGIPIAPPIPAPISASPMGDMSSGQQQPMTNEMLSQQLGGQPVGQTDPNQPGLFHSTVQAIAHPFLVLASSALNTGAVIRDFIDSHGAPSAQATQDLAASHDYGYFGKAAPLTAGDTVRGGLQNAGVGLEAASYFTGAGEAKAASEAGLLSKTISGAKAGLKTGAVFGGVQGLGSGLEDPNATVGSVLKNTAEGTIGGGVGGVVLGGALGATSSILKNWRGDVTPSSMTHDINPPDGGTPPGTSGPSGEGGFKGWVTQKVYNSTKKDWENILNLPNSVKNEETLSGKSVVDLLTRNGIVPDGIENGQAVLDNAKDSAFKNAVSLGHIQSALLETEPKMVSITDILNGAVGKLKSTGIDLDNAVSYAQKQLESFIRQNGVEPTEDGLLRLGEWDKIKGEAWKIVTDFGDPARSIKNDVNSAIARSIKATIEKNVTDANIKAINSEIGDWWHAFEVLGDRNGKKVYGRGLSRVMNRVAGSTVGAISHGLGGGVIGGVIGDKLSAILTDSTIGMGLKMKILQNLMNDPVTSDVVKNAIELIQQRTQDSLTRLSLPAPEAPGVGIDTPNVPPSSRGQTPGRGQRVIYAGPATGTSQGSMSGSVPRPDIAQGAGIFVKPRSGLQITDIPKVRLPKK